MGQTTEKIFERARLNLEQDNHENALRLFNEVLNREPSHQKALRSKALIKILTANAEEAEEFLLFAIVRQPEDDQLYQMLGTFYHNNEQPGKALKKFKSAVELNKTNRLAQQGLGMIYANCYGEHEKAILHFSKALNSEETSADIYFYRGCSFMILQQMNDAEKDLQEATQKGHSKAAEMLKEHFDYEPS